MNDSREEQTMQDQSSPSPMLARTTTLGNYPTSPRSHFAMVPLRDVGDPAEGNDAVYEVAGEPFLALNIGSSIPPVGTRMIVDFVSGRWMFDYNV